MIFSNHSKKHTWKRLAVKMMVVCFLVGACFRGTHLCTLAQDADRAEYAGSTTVKAYVSAEPADVQEEESERIDKVDDNVETDDENKMALWIIILVSSLTVLVCGKKVAQ